MGIEVFEDLIDGETPKDKPHLNLLMPLQIGQKTLTSNIFSNSD